MCNHHMKRLEGTIVGAKQLKGERGRAHQKAPQKPTNGAKPTQSGEGFIPQHTSGLDGFAGFI